MSVPGGLSHRVDEDEEIIVKAMTDYWVVGKKSDQRELYVILNQKNANLIEVNGKSNSSCHSTCNSGLIPELLSFFPQRKLRGSVQHSSTIYSSWTDAAEGFCLTTLKLPLDNISIVRNAIIN